MCHHEGVHGQEESLVTALVPDIQHGFAHLSQMYQHLFATPPKTPCPGIFRWIHGELSRTVLTRPTNMIKSTKWVLTPNAVLIWESGHLMSHQRANKSPTQDSDGIRAFMLGSQVSGALRQPRIVVHVT